MFGVAEGGVGFVFYCGGLAVDCGCEEASDGVGSGVFVDFLDDGVGLWRLGAFGG